MYERFTDEQVARVMSRTRFGYGSLPTDAEARDIVRAAVDMGILSGIESFHLTDEGDYIAILQRDPKGFACTAAGPISTRYLWRSGQRGADAVRHMLTSVDKEVAAVRTGVHPDAEADG